MISVLLSAYSFYQNWPGGWLAVAILAVITAVIINAILLAIAKGFSIRELERFSESEILQAVSTAVIAIFLVFLVEGAESYLFSSGLIHGEIECGGTTKHLGIEADGIFTNALDYVRCSIQQKALGIADVQERAITGADAYFAFNAMNLQMSIIGITFFKGDWINDLYQATEKWRLVNMMATNLLVGLNAVSFLVLYVKNNMLHLFLPLGILLRSFYFTRSLGAFLMSLGIGLYFIFPVLYILLDPGFVHAALPQSQLAVPDKMACYPTFSTATTLVSTAQSSAFSTSALALDSLQNELSKAYISLLLHPLIALFVTLAFVRYIMTVLGGDTYELTKLVTKMI